MSIPLCTHVPSLSASINISQSLSVTSASPIKITAGMARGSSHGALPPISCDPAADDHSSKPAGHGGLDGERPCAGRGTQLPYSTTVELRSSMTTPLRDNTLGLSDAPSKYRNASAHSSLTSQTTCSHQRRCDIDNDGPLVENCAQSQSTSSVHLPRRLPITQSSLTHLNSKRITEPVQVTVGGDRPAASPLRGASDLDNSGATKQVAYTSYSVHRVLSRKAHPQFTGHVKPLFTEHPTSQPNPMTNIHSSPEDPVSDHNLQRLPPTTAQPHSIQSGSVCSEKTQTGEATPITSAWARESAGNNDASLRARRETGKVLLPPMTWPSTECTTSPRYSQPLPPHARCPSSLNSPTSVTSNSDSLMQTDFTKSPLLGQPTEMTLRTLAFGGGVAASLLSWKRTRGFESLLGTAVCQQNSSLESLSTTFITTPCDRCDKKEASGTTASGILTEKMPLPFMPHHHDEQALPTSVSDLATLVMSDAYSMQDIKRGTWVFSLAQKECLAREHLEAEETSKALRCLPASWAVWRTYADDNLGSASHEVDSLSSGIDMAASLSLDASNQVVVLDRATHFSSTPDRLGQDRTKSEEVTEPPIPTLHPAFVAAEHRLDLIEQIRRGYVLKEEQEEFFCHLQKPFAYEHRLLLVGTRGIAKFLHDWILIHRAKKFRRARQIATLEKLEEEARVALHVTSHTMQRRLELFVMAILEEEHRCRYALELLYTIQAARTGVVLLKLQEQVERFPLAFGGLMSQPRVCGRVVGFTLFSNLVIAEDAIRRRTTDEEARQRAKFPTELDLTLLNLVHEPLKRKELVDCEADERAVVHQVVRSLQAHYSIREVEIEESIERQFWLKKRMRKGLDPVVANAAP